MDYSWIPFALLASFVVIRDVREIVKDVRNTKRKVLAVEDYWHRRRAFSVIEGGKPSWRR